MSQLPIEIYEKIFSFISDTNTYGNIRLVCKMFRNIQIDVKQFENNKLKYVFKMNENNDFNIFNNQLVQVGFIKQVYPLTIHYSIQDNNELIEYFYRPTYITKQCKLLNENNLEIVTKEMYNIHTKQATTSHTSRYINSPFNNQYANQGQCCIS